MDFYLNKIAERLGGARFGTRTELYKFEKIKKAKAAAKQQNPQLPLIDLGVGEPDRPADPEIVRVLAENAGKAENRFYADNGIPEFQQAAAAFLASYFGVTGLDPAENIIHGIGTKSILALLPLCVINPGDICLATVPGYGVIGTYTRYLGGTVYPLPLRQEHNFLPLLGEIPARILNKAKLLYLNYPNNPTGAAATGDFFRQVVDFAHQHNIMIVHDAAYAALCYAGNPPLSLLSVNGAVEVAVEVHSLSKSFNMTGWRLGFLAGSREIIRAYGTVKDNTDSGQFRAIQHAGIYALNHPQLIAENCRRYARRFELLVPVLQRAGFTAAKPGGSFYCYVKAPAGARGGVTFHSAEEAAEFLLRQALISTVPWDEAGACLRLAVTFEAATEDAEKRVMADLEQRLLALELRFAEEKS